MARYLVTYAQYQAFVEAEDGFSEGKWWIDFPEEFQIQSLEMQQQRYANYPRDTLSWYQAVAFTRWLNDVLTDDALPAKHNWEIRLPTEWERLWAASSGQPHRKFPWGNEWRTNYANTNEAGLGRSTAVGMYPAGQIACGAFDINGNIHEWCLNQYTRLNFMAKFHTIGAGVLRGGAFENPASYARLASRYANHRERNRTSSGFRLVYAPPAILN